MPIYENSKGERLIKYKFIENINYICFRNFTKAEKYGNKTTKEYCLNIDTSKEISMIENNKIERRKFLWKKI